MSFVYYGPGITIHRSFGIFTCNQCGAADLEKVNKDQKTCGKEKCQTAERIRKYHLNKRKEAARRNRV